MRNRAGAAVAAVLLLATACSGGDDDTVAQPSPSPSPSPEPDPLCPLTGEEPGRGVDLDRPAIAVKIEDSPEARPQSGLESADLVFEEVVEGGITRFMAIYHCGESEKVGPVRSARFDDPKIAYPFTRVLAFSGANDIVGSELVKQKMLVLDEDTAEGGLFRDPPGSTDVHSLFANTEKLRAQAKPGHKPPEDDIFVFGNIKGRAKKARSVTLHFTSSNPIEYRWEGKSWRRYEGGEPFFTSVGDQIAVPNVLVQEVKVDNSNTIVDAVGNPSPDITLSGTGRALLFRDGQVIKGKWRIPKEFGPASYRTKAGIPFVFAPGPIWIELVPSKAGEAKGSISYK